MAKTDTRFFTNEPGASLLDRFKQTLKDVQFFDALVGYFQTSGFHQLYEDFEQIEKIRILVRLGIDKQAFVPNQNESKSILNLSEYEEINSRLYKLYGLTREEIAFLSSRD